MNNLKTVVMDFTESAIDDGIAQEEGNVIALHQCVRCIPLQGSALIGVSSCIL